MEEDLARQTNTCVWFVRKVQPESFFPIVLAIGIWYSALLQTVNPSEPQYTKYYSRVNIRE